jgi:hypothetical protein
MTTPTALKPVPGYPFLSADNTGSIWLQKDDALTRLNAWETKAGYLVVSVPGRSSPLYAHRLTLMAWVGPPAGPKMVTRHIDHCKTNNIPSNLCWGTQRDNTSDRMKSGKRFTGESNPAAKLTEKDVHAARILLEFNIPKKDIAKRLGVSVFAIRSLASGRTWRVEPPAAAPEVAA